RGLAQSAAAAAVGDLGDAFRARHLADGEEHLDDEAAVERQAAALGEAFFDRVDVRGGVDGLAELETRGKRDGGGDTDTGEAADRLRDLEALVGPADRFGIVGVLEARLRQRRGGAGLRGAVAGAARHLPRLARALL